MPKDDMLAMLARQLGLNPTDYADESALSQAVDNALRGRSGTPNLDSVSGVGSRAGRSPRATDQVPFKGLSGVGVDPNAEAFTSGQRARSAYQSTKKGLQGLTLEKAGPSMIGEDIAKAVGIAENAMGKPIPKTALARFLPMLGSVGRFIGGPYGIALFLVASLTGADKAVARMLGLGTESAELDLQKQAMQERRKGQRIGLAIQAVQGAQERETDIANQVMGQTSQLAALGKAERATANQFESQLLGGQLNAADLAQGARTGGRSVEQLIDAIIRTDARTASEAMGIN